MNALAGWGFASPDALDRYVRRFEGFEAVRKVDRTQPRWVTPQKIEAYAATLTEAPKPWEVMETFNCCYASALKHRRKIADIIGRRATNES